MTVLWPWLVLVGLGAFHGLNPAMGWLFAVALGLHRNSGRVVLLALLPLALGHALSIGVVVAAVLTLGLVVETGGIRIVAGAALIVWAIYHQIYGHRHRVRVGMRTGLAGLALWSFLMATVHGAGLMLLPALIPICTAAGTVGPGAAGLSVAAVGVHTLSMLLVTGLIAAVVYRWLGLGFLRRGWINFDILWSGMLVASGALLLVTGRHP